MITQENFKPFVREFRELMLKYGVRVKANSEQIDFSAFINICRPTGDVYPVHYEREACISFTEFLTHKEAMEIEGRGEAEIIKG